MDNVEEITPEGLMALLAADAVMQKVERHFPECAGLHDLFRENSAPENRDLLETFDAACDNFRQQFYALEDVRRLTPTKAVND